MSAAPAAPAPLLTIPEVAQRLRIHRATVYRRIHSGELKVSVNLGIGNSSKPRISEDDLQAYLEKREVGTR